MHFLDVHFTWKVSTRMNVCSTQHCIFIYWRVRTNKCISMILCILKLLGCTEWHVRYNVTVGSVCFTDDIKLRGTRIMFDKSKIYFVRGL